MVDDIDKKIINTLSEDSTTSINDIAKVCKVSRGTVRLRINKLKQEGIILGSNAVVKYQNVGMVESVLGLDIAPEYYMSALDSLRKMDFVKHLYRTSGDHSAIAIVVAESIKIDNYIESIKNVKGIRNIYPAFVQDILK